MSKLLSITKIYKTLATVINTPATPTNAYYSIVAALPSPCCWVRSCSLRHSLPSPPPPTLVAASAEHLPSQLRTIQFSSLRSTLHSAPLSLTFVGRSRHSCSAAPPCQSVSLQRHSYCTYHKYRKDMDVPVGIFRGSVDRFNGITVDSKKEYEPNVDFEKKLQCSLEYWQENKRRGIWFKIHTEHVEWVPLLAKFCFEFHHADQGFVYMYRWISENESSNIPHFAHTFLGVGGIVINDKQEVLVVTDRFALIPNSWKLPGGYMDPCEDIVDATIREVKEETGILCDFNTVVSIRHSHSGLFGCSDLYAVVALTPQNLDISRCQREIARVQWMPIAEYMKHPHVHETNRFFMRTFLDYQKRGLRFTYKRATHEILKIDYMLYYIQPIEEDQQK